MAVTRIKNNQITDSTITGAKIANTTLTGGLFATSLTLNSEVSIVGNLSVTGTTSTVSSTNTFINDPLVVYNNGYTGDLSNYSIGLLVNRNLAALAELGSVNVAWVWDEAQGAFVAIATTDTGSGVTSINNSGYANVKVGSLVALINENDNPSKTEDEYKAISGSWMVSSIQHLVSTPSLYYMILTLVRDSNYFDPNDIQSPEAPFR